MSFTIEQMESSSWPADDLERVTHCPVCGGSKRRELYSGLTDRAFRCSPGEWTLYGCDDCSVCYLDPRPTSLSIGRAYAEYYTHESPELESDLHLTGAKALSKRLDRGYINARFGYSMPRGSSLGPFILLFSPIHRRLIDAEMRFLRKPDTADATLLDLGCGNGDFLLKMQALGWTVQGLDLDLAAVEAARSAGLDVLDGVLDETTFPAATFDAITMSHVAEHLHNPVETLKQCYRVLKPGGSLFILTPNIESIGSRTFGRNWRGLEPPRHLVIFTFDSLAAACRIAGFSVELALGTPRAKFLFTRSVRIQEGRDLTDGPWRLSAAQQIAYKIANIRSIFIPTDSEEIMMVVRRPRS